MRVYVVLRLAPALTAVLLAVSCARIEPYLAIFQDWNYSFDDGGAQFASLADLGTWVNRSIAYRSDPQGWGWTEYWASPAQTFEAKRGDCEDQALLFMYFAYTRHLAANPELVAIVQPDGIGHGIVRIGDTFYDLTNAKTIGAADMTDSVLFTLNYGQAMYIAITDHAAYRGIAKAGTLGRIGPPDSGP